METREARVRVPASCANVGSGFDCIGFAVDRWLTASVAVSADDGEPSVTMQRAGTLAALTLAPVDDALVAGFQAACAARGLAVPRRLAFTVHSDIPVARGLGSSSAALVAGASLASRALALDLSRDEIAQLCTTLEGHPDNVAPAVFGGAVLGLATGGPDGRGWMFAPLEVHPTLAFAFVVPALPVETAAAREALPSTVPYGLAVEAVARSAALVQGLTSGNGALLELALDDVLHVPFREHLISGYREIVAAARIAGAYGATLSGSGSAMVAIAPQATIAAVAAAMERSAVVAGHAAESFVQRAVSPAE